jgi:hypothetical protein
MSVAALVIWKQTSFVDGNGKPETVSGEPKIA